MWKNKVDTNQPALIVTHRKKDKKKLGVKFFFLPMHKYNLLMYVFLWYEWLNLVRWCLVIVIYMTVSIGNIYVFLYFKFIKKKDRKTLYLKNYK